MTRWIVLALLMVGSAGAQAVLPSEQLADPKLEARALGITRDLRCVVCQNQSIDDSDAPLAHDLRVLVRERLSAGDSDRQARDYIVARYGHFVLLKPPFEPNTLLLWLGPALVLLLGGFGVWRYLSGREVAAERELNAEERARADALLRDSE